MVISAPVCVSLTMHALRVVLVVMGVVLCLCATVRGGSNDSASTWADTESLRSYHSLYTRILKMVKNAEHGGGELAQATGEKENKHHNHHHHHQTKSGDQILGEQTNTTIQLLQLQLSDNVNCVCVRERRYIMILYCVTDGSNTALFNLVCGYIALL